MAKLQYALNFSKTMVEVKDTNEIFLYECNKDGEVTAYNLTNEMRKLESEANVNVKISFDNEVDAE